MNHRLASRVITILLLGFLFGLYIHGDNKKWSQLGRQAYIDHELEDFDSTKAEPHPAIFMIIGSIVVTSAFFGLYELLVFLLSAIFKRVLPRDRNQQRTPTPASVPFS
jgi:hypothetical protein